MPRTHTLPDWSIECPRHADLIEVLRDISLGWADGARGQDVIEAHYDGVTYDNRRNGYLDELIRPMPRLEPTMRPVAADYFIYAPTHAEFMAVLENLDWRYSTNSVRAVQRILASGIVSVGSKKDDFPDFPLPYHSDTKE